MKTSAQEAEGNGVTIYPTAAMMAQHPTAATEAKVRSGG
jgi:hypothetical protein